MKEKTATSGVRYKIDQVEFIKKREGLKTLQEVFYFLTEEYSKLYKTETKSVFAAVTDATDHSKTDQSKKSERTTSAYHEKKELTFNEHMDKIATLVFSDERQEYIPVIQQSPTLTDKQKQLLILNLKHSAG